MPEVPLHCLTHAFIKSLARRPAQLTLELAGIDRIATIVTGTVRDKRNEFFVRSHRRGRVQFIQQATQGLHDIDILALAVPADIISLTRFAPLQHDAYRLAMIPHVEPVANVATVTIHGQGFPLDRVLDNERDQFLRKLIRAVIVGTVRGQRRQTISVVIGPHQVIRTGLGR